MASGMYAATKKVFLDGGINLPSDTIKCILLDSDYTHNYATDNFYDDVPAGGRVGTAQTLASKTTTDGVFDAADVTFTAVSNATNVIAVIIYKDTGSEATSNVIARLEFTAITPNGGDIVVSWDNGANKIFALT